jgi:DNA-binding CsgD family transcriptional regulator
MSSMPCCRPFGGDELFVGRSEELVFLHAQLDGVRGGAPRLVLIEGAAGIGKTALVRRFLAGANELTVLQASGAEGESILAYGVLSQLISTARAAAPDAPTILPDTGAPGPDSIKHLNPLTAGAALLSLLGELQVTGPAALVMVVDDAHWADVPSLQALTFAVRRLGVNRVLGIVITRDASDTHLPEGLRRVLASHETQRLVLEGLVAADLCTLSGAFGPRALPSRAAARLRAHTRGNPLHARALFEQVPMDVLSDLRAPLPAPRSYSLLVLARLASCGDSAQRLVGAASVLGLPAPLRLAAQLAGISDPLPALEEALRAGLLCEESGSGQGPVAKFPHPLIRAAVYQDLGPTRRARLHKQAAGLVNDDLSALQHRLDAAIGPDPQLTNELAALARRHVAAGLWATGGTLLSQAARLVITDAERQRLSVEAIEALLFTGQIDEARTLAAELPQTADPAVRGYIAGHLTAVTGRVPEAIELLTAAWEVGDRDTRPWLTARIADQLAKSAVQQTQGAQAATWAARTLALSAHRPGTDLIRCTHLMGLGMCGGIAEGLALTAGLPDPALATVADLDSLLGRGLLRTWADDLRAAIRDLLGVLATGRNRSVPFRLLAAAALGQAEYRLGHWDNAILHAEMATALARDVGQIALVPMSATVTALASAARGDWEDAAASVAAAQDSAERTGSLSGLVYAASADAHLAAALGDPQHVVTALRPLLDIESGTGIYEPGVMSWQDLLIDALTASSEPDQAQSILIPYEAHAAARRRHSVLVNACRARGNLSLARHDPEAAEAAFSTGLQYAAQVSLPFDRARLELAYGAFLRRTGKRTAATQHLQAARITLTRLGARPYLARCGSELAACGHTPSSRPPTFPLGLTPQEHAIALLAAKGLTNRQIARDLVLSVKTIEYHLSHAYAKLNIPSRAALAAMLASDLERWGART